MRNCKGCGEPITEYKLQYHEACKPVYQKISTRGYGWNREKYSEIKVCGTCHKPIADRLAIKTEGASFYWCCCPKPELKTVRIGYEGRI